MTSDDRGTGRDDGDGDDTGGRDGGVTGGRDGDSRAVRTSGDGLADGGGTTQTSGTPMAVELSSSPATRRALALFVAGPTIWFTHFMLVYLVAEAGCTGDGAGLSRLDPPVPAIVTLVATAVAGLACLGVAWWEHREWRGGDRLGAREAAGGPPGGTEDDPDDRPLAFVGMLLGLVSFMSVLFVGLPALWITGC